MINLCIINYNKLYCLLIFIIHQVYLKEDFFQLLPKEVRPWNAMLLWGTAYSRSTLHIGAEQYYNIFA